MKSEIRYPYHGSHITTKQAVDLIVEVVYPDIEKAIARKRIFSRIKYARAQGRLTQSNSLIASDFFGWALNETRDWGALRAVRGIPLPPNNGGASMTMEPLTGSSYCVTVPEDHQILRDEFCRSENARMRQADEIRALKQRIADLETEVTGWHEKYLQMRGKRSEAGKKGGRGNTL